MNATQELLPVIDVAQHQDRPLVAATVTPATLLQLAVAQGANLDRLEKLMDLQDRYEAREAKKAFDAAMAAFKASAPKLVKDKHVSYRNKTGGLTEYDHATHGEVTEKIATEMAYHGLSHRWNVEQGDKNLIKVTCIVTHVGGHSEQVAMHSPPDDSGGKNSIQGIASAVTYLQRYTLLACTGMSTAEQDEADDDGRMAAPTSAEPWPEGYESKFADLRAVADDGTAKLQEAWRAQAEPFRTWLLKNRPAAWAQVKDVAAAADSSAAAQRSGS